MDTADRIFLLLDRSGMATDKIVSKWRTSGLKSYRKYLPQIAEVLGTSVEYLVTGVEKKPAPITESGLDATKYHMLNEENRALVDQMIEKLLKSQSGE